jgi:hypothetical protein
VERSNAFVTDAALQGHRTSIAEFLQETCPWVQPYWVRMKHGSISVTGFDVCLAVDIVCPNTQEQTHFDDTLGSGAGSLHGSSEM